MTTLPFFWPRPPILDIPALPPLGLSEDEKQLLGRLVTVALHQRHYDYLTQAYYLGEFIVRNLRIAVPKELEFLRTIVGWPALAVDPYVERLFIDGFRLPNATDEDSDLADMWHANGLDAELSLSVTDALSMGRSFWVVGSPTEPGGPPRITVESPLNTAALYDQRGDEPSAVFAEYWQDGRRHATLLLPNQTITMATDEPYSFGNFEVVDRDEHDFGFVPVVRMANQPTTTDRNGRSAITPAVMSITDSACRTLLGLEVARELYSVPQKMILGATESDFLKADGTAKGAWDTYITKILAIERDDEGNLPTIHQSTPYTPAVFTNLIEMYAAQMASLVAAPPQELGLYTTGNPVSADAVDASEDRRNRRAQLHQSTFGVALRKVMQYAVRFTNNGVLPDDYQRLYVDWKDLEKPSMGQAADAMAKQSGAGIVPPTSDVVLKRLGYSWVERQRLEQDRAQDAGASVLAELASSLQAKEARTDIAVASDIVGKSAAEAPGTSATPAAPTPPAAKPTSGNAG